MLRCWACQLQNMFSTFQHKHHLPCLMWGIIFGLPWTCEKRAFSKDKPPSRTDFEIVFYVLYYLWLTMHMWEEGIHKGKTFRPHRFWDCLLCCVIFLVYRSHVRSGHSQRRNLQAPQILGLSSMLCIIFGLPCTCEKRAFSKEKPPGAGSRKQQNVGQGTGSTTSGAVILHS